MSGTPQIEGHVNNRPHGRGGAPVAAHWDVSVQTKEHLATCARCNETFQAGDLRLRPAGTSRTRLIHPACSYGLCSGMDSVMNASTLDLPQQQHLQTLLRHAMHAPPAPEDVTTVSLAPPRDSEEMDSNNPLYNGCADAVRNMQQWDSIEWDSLRSCPRLIREVPSHWITAVAEAKLMAIREVQRAKHTGVQIDMVRAWKLVSAFDSLILAARPKQRGGSRGQGHASLNKTLSNRLRAFHAGAWHQLMLELDYTQAPSVKKPRSQAPAALDARDAHIVQHLADNQAASKAMARACEPLRFATGPSVPSKLQAKCPPLRAPPANCPSCPTPDAPLRAEFVEHIQSQFARLPVMSGAGPNGSYYEHWAIASAVPSGVEDCADVLAMLFTGEAPKEAVQFHRSGRMHSPLKPDSDTDIRPLASASVMWRIAARAWVDMFKLEVREAVGETQFGVAHPGGCTSLRHRLTAWWLAHPTWGLASLDIQNMFGTLDCSNTEQEVLHRVPRMWSLTGH